MSRPAESEFKPLPDDTPPEVGEVLLAILRWRRYTDAEESKIPVKISTLDVNTTGEFTTGVLILDAPYSVAVKTHGRSDGTGQLESLILKELSQASPPPLEIPAYIGYKSRIPHKQLEQIWMSKVEGEKLETATVRRSSPEQKRAIGQKLGHFVAWMAAAISPERYHQLHTEAGSLVLADRTDNIRRYVEAARTNPAMDSELATLMLEIDAELDERLKEESAAKKIVADDDFRAANINVIGEEALGKFDFGICRPVSTERALRHTLVLGTEVADAAIESYEAVRGQKLSRELLRFWALGQTASVVAAFCLGDIKPREWIPDDNDLIKAEAERWFKDLAYIVPDRDWSGLTVAT